MKLKTLLLSTALVASTAFADAPAPADKKHMNHSDDYYAKIEAGITMPERIRQRGSSTNLRSRNSFVGGLGAGYQISEFFRTDLMLQYRELRLRSRDRITSIRSEAFTALLNGYVDGHNDTIFTPYLMAGIGVSHANTRVTIASASARARQRVHFAWNVGAGAQAKVADQISLDLGYRYVSVGRPSRFRGNLSSTRFSRDLRTHEVVAGLIWSF